MLTSSSGRSIGVSRRMMALTRLKIAVFAPIPTARDNTATAVNPGRRPSDRMLSRMSRFTDSNMSRMCMFGPAGVSLGDEEMALCVPSRRCYADQNPVR